MMFVHTLFAQGAIIILVKTPQYIIYFYYPHSKIPSPKKTADRKAVFFYTLLHELLYHSNTALISNQTAIKTQIIISAHCPFSFRTILIIYRPLFVHVLYHLLSLNLVYIIIFDYSLYLSGILPIIKTSSTSSLSLKIKSAQRPTITQGSPSAISLIIFFCALNT